MAALADKNNRVIFSGPKAKIEAKVFDLTKNQGFDGTEALALVLSDNPVTKFNTTGHTQIAGAQFAPEIPRNIHRINRPFQNGAEYVVALS